MSSRPLPAHAALPIQSQQFTKEQLTDPSVMNVWYQQVIDELNRLNGTLGPVPQPSGIDMRGQRVSNLGPPKNDGDAISSGHANTQFGAVAQQDQLDIGKPHALRGLSTTFALTQQNQQAITALQAAVALAANVLTSGSTTPLSAPIIQMGNTAAISTTLAVTFPLAFPNTVPFVVACDDYAGASASIISVEKASVTKTGFTVHSNGTTSGAWWIAIGN